MVPSKVMAKNWNRLIANVVENDLDEDKMLLPHVIVTRGSRMLLKTTFSLLKGKIYTMLEMRGNGHLSLIYKLYSKMPLF